MNKYLLITILFLSVVLFNSCEDEQEDYSNRLFIGGKAIIYYTFSDSTRTEVYEKTEEQYGLPIRFQMFENGKYIKDVIADSWGYLLNVPVSEGKRYQFKLVIDSVVLFESSVYIPKKNESEYLETDEGRIETIPRSGLRFGHHFALKDFIIRIENNPERLFIRPNPFKPILDVEISLSSSNTYSLDIFNLNGEIFEIDNGIELELNRIWEVRVNFLKLKYSLTPGNYIFRLKNGYETFYQMAVLDTFDLADYIEVKP